MRYVFIIIAVLVLIIGLNTSEGGFPDEDRDTVANYDDTCSNTVPGSIVDEDGCSCAQKDCPFNDNICIDDCGIGSLGKAQCGSFNNNAQCEQVSCPEAHCDRNYPYVNWIEWSSDGVSRCSRGRCSYDYSCYVSNIIANYEDCRVEDWEPEVPSQLRITHSATSPVTRGDNVVFTISASWD